MIGLDYGGKLVKSDLFFIRDFFVDDYGFGGGCEYEKMGVICGYLLIGNI